MKLTWDDFDEFTKIRACRYFSEFVVFTYLLTYLQNTTLYPCSGAGRSTPVFPVRHSLVQLGPQRLRFPRRWQADLELAQHGSAVRTEFQDVRESSERVHDGVKRVGGAEFVEEQRRRIWRGRRHSGSRDGRRLSTLYSHLCSTKSHLYWLTQHWTSINQSINLQFLE